MKYQGRNQAGKRTLQQAWPRVWAILLVLSLALTSCPFIYEAEEVRGEEADTVVWSGDADVTEDATYRATYKETVNQYTVKWVNDNGTVLDSKTLDYGSLIPEYSGKTPEKASTEDYTYTFEKWTADKEAGDTITGDITYTAAYTETKIPKVTIAFTDDITYAAAYTETEIPKVTIAFDGNGGSGSMDSVRHNKGEEYTLPGSGFDGTIAHKRFTGWKVNNEGEILKPGARIRPEEDITLYAQWEDAVARIDDRLFVSLGEANGALSADGQTITLLQDIDLGDEHYDVIARHVYTIDLNGHTISSANGSQTILFRGTSNGNFKSIVTVKDTSSKKTGKIINTSDGGAAIKMTDGSLTLESGTLQGNNVGLLMAQDEAISWERGKSIINGGTIIGNNSSIGWHHDDATINGGRFSDDAGNASVLPEGQKLFKDDDGYYRLHEILTVSFAAGEGSGTMENVEAGKGAPYTLPSPKFTAPAGFGFDGWKVGVNDEVRRPGEKVILSDDTTLTAVWSDNAWVVSFDAGDGSGTMADGLAVKGGKYTLPDNEFEGPEYRETFAGWKIEGSDELKQPGDLVEITSDTTVTAQWKSSKEFYIFVQGIMVNGENYRDVLGDLDGDGATVFYDPKSDTLTLDNATIEAGSLKDEYDEGVEFGILVEDASEEFSIVLKGTNAIADKVHEKGSAEVLGIFYGGFAGKITGDGSLAINFTSQSNDGSRAYCGILDYTDQQGITIDGATISIKTAGPEESTGMEHGYKYAKDNNLTLINGAKLLIETDSSEHDSRGIDGYELSVSEDSLLEVLSKGENGKAIADSTLTYGTVALGATVNTEATRKGAVKWDNETDLSNYKYVRIPYAADKSGLQKAIAAAQKAEENVAVSADGKNVEPSGQWTTPAEKKALDDAIAAAQKVMNDDAVTQQEVDEAADAVKAATDAYNKAKKAGKLVRVKSLALKSAEVQVGKTAQMPYTLTPSNATNKKVTWKSADQKIAAVDANGRVTGKKVGETTITGTTEDGKKTSSAKMLVSFTDVPRKGQYYSEPVYWAVNKAITNGFTDADGLARTFKPKNNCTRAEMVTFLWRHAGKPAPKTKKNPFKDVKSNAYYYKAVLWAVEKGITKGYDDGTFKPNATCLREHAVTFLWRYAGKPGVSSKKGFKDIKAKDYYYKAVLWAVNKGITKGYSDGTFKPKANCQREHIVTFLYRYKK